MTTLTIYSPKFDSNEDICNGGMSGRAFIDVDNSTGAPFDSIDDALNYIHDNAVAIHRIEFNYVDGCGCQAFRKFEIASGMVNTMP